jgi:hypothetical protein
LRGGVQKPGAPDTLEAISHTVFEKNGITMSFEGIRETLSQGHPQWVAVFCEWDRYWGFGSRHTPEKASPSVFHSPMASNAGDLQTQARRREKS